MQRRLAFFSQQLRAGINIGIAWLSKSLRIQTSMRRIETELLACAGRLLLEYNESTNEIHRTLENTSVALSSEKCDIVVSYGGVAVSHAGDGPLLLPVRELRYNAALQARVHAILAQVCRKELAPTRAYDQLKNIEADTPRHARWLAIVLLGVAGSALAALLGADAGAMIAVGLSTGLGLAARQELGRRYFNLLTLPLTASFIGAVVGGLATQFGWTQTSGLALVVPSLMLIPGPHLINGLLDLVDNYVPMGLARLGLATGILMACALGIVAGMELTLPDISVANQNVTADHLNVFTDMLLAAIVTVGFAAFYNTAWLHIGLAALGGIIGHGLRFLLLEVGARLEVATFFGALAVGVISACIARSYKLPIAVVSFAGAVTMMPGIQMYRALGGARQIARLSDSTDLTTLGRTAGDAVQSGFVVAALGLGLIVAARVVPMLAGGKSTT